jgi:microcystin-dependent protein
MTTYMPRLKEASSFLFYLFMSQNQRFETRLAQNEAGDAENLRIDNLKHVLVGDYKWSARQRDFNGWLVCDGRSLSRVTFAALFAVLGTAFGADDANTFKLPDARGRTTCGVGQGVGLTNRTLGAYVGEENHTLTIGEMPGHTHTGTTASNGAHDHGASTGNNGSHTHTINDPGHTHTQTTNNDDFNSSGTNPPGFTADSAGTMTWSNINGSTTGITVNSVGNHAHTIATDGAHTHTFTTNSTGGSAAHNVMQPSVFIGNLMVYSGVEQPVLSFTPNLMATAEWVTDNSWEYVEAIPGWYRYRYDQNMRVAFGITDGGQDMYDGGNYISVEGDAISMADLSTNPVQVMGRAAVLYGSLYNKPDGSAGVYVSAVDTYPHIAIAFVQSGTLLLRSFGNAGSDNYGTVANYSASYACANGRTGTFWANINYGTSDPTIADVWFTITHPSWGSAVTNVVDQRKTRDNNIYNHYVSVTGTNYYFCKALLSVGSGAFLDQATVTSFLTNYVQNMRV